MSTTAGIKELETMTQYLPFWLVAALLAAAIFVLIILNKRSIQLPEAIVNGLKVFRKIAVIIWLAMIAYLIVISTHWLFGFDARQTHSIGILSAVVVFIIVFIHRAKKYGWGDKLEEIIEKD